MTEALKNIMSKMNDSDGDIIESIPELVQLFTESRPRDDHDLIVLSRKKIGEVFSLEKLKEYDMHFVSTELLNLISMSETVSDLTDIGSYMISNEDERVSILIQVLGIKLSDHTEVHVLNMQEEVKDAAD